MACVGVADAPAPLQCCGELGGAGIPTGAVLHSHGPGAGAIGDAALTSAAASALLDQFVQQPGVSYAQPSSEGWDVFHGFMRQADLSPRLCTDAHLAALAITNQWRLVSFDRDFHLFSGLNLLQLR